jgi:transcription termination/antitermination protein NusG
MPVDARNDVTPCAASECVAKTSQTQRAAVFPPVGNIATFAEAEQSSRIPTPGSGLSVLPEYPEYYEALWYAAYTSANHEKRVSEQLGVRKVEHFLPLYASIRRWKDRRVKLELPLFPGYVFVRMALRDRLQVLRVPGVARLVGFDGAPATLPAEEIEALRTSLGSAVRAAPHPYLTAGRRVRVQSGPLAGMTGILVRRKGVARFVVSVDLIQRSVAMEVDEADLVAVG